MIPFLKMKSLYLTSKMDLCLNKILLIQNTRAAEAAIKVIQL